MNLWKGNVGGVFIRLLVVLECVEFRAMPIWRCYFVAWFALIASSVVVMGRPADPNRYWRSGDSRTSGNARFAPTRPANVEVSRNWEGQGEAQSEAKEDGRQELRSARYAPRRPGEERLLVDPVRLPNMSGRNLGERFAPTRPKVASGGWVRDENFGTVYGGYMRLEGENLSADFRAAEPWVRDFEGTAKRKVKKAVWKKLVTAPVKVAFRAGTKAVVKVAVGSWVPFL